jgi:hypothetical protein
MLIMVPKWNVKENSLPKKKKTIYHKNSDEFMFSEVFNPSDHSETETLQWAVIECNGF